MVLGRSTISGIFPFRPWHYVIYGSFSVLKTPENSSSEIENEIHYTSFFLEERVKFG